MKRISRAFRCWGAVYAGLLALLLLVTAPLPSHASTFTLTLYVGDQQGTLYAIDATVGSTRWRVTVGGELRSTPRAVPGHVYVGSSNASVSAFTTANGTPLWNTATGGAVFGSPVIGANTVVYIGSDDHVFYAVDGTTGARLWHFADPTNVFRSSALEATVGGQLRIYVPTANTGMLYALDSTGSKVWGSQIPPHAGSLTMPAADLAHDLLYVGASDGSLYVFNAETGALVWSFPTGAAIVDSAVVSNGLVYIGSNNGTLYALNDQTGALVWSFPTGNGVLASPTVLGDRIFLAGFSNNTVYALNASTGALIWTFHPTFPSFIRTGLVYFMGMLYVVADKQLGDEQGSVYAVNAGNGAYVWRWDALPGGRFDTELWPALQEEVLP